MSLKRSKVLILPPFFIFKHHSIMSWASRISTPTAATLQVSAAPMQPPTTSAPVTVDTPRAFAFAATSSTQSWANVATPSNALGFNSKVQLSRAQDLKKIEFDLESSRAGLNLAFKSVVKTSSSSSSSSLSSASSFVAATPAPQTALRTETPSTATNAANTAAAVVAKELSAGQIAKRVKQLGFGKNTVGYKNYVHHVPKKERKESDVTHPTTPKTNKGSKRAFAGLVKNWRRAIHFWDDKGPHTQETVAPVASTTTAAAAGMAATTAAIQEQLLNQPTKQKRVMRTKSWADMADSDDSDSEDEDMSDAKVQAVGGGDDEEFQGLRTKRKATDELLPARMEKRANTTEVEEVEPTKPKSKALQLVAARKAKAAAAAALVQ